MIDTGGAGPSAGTATGPRGLPALSGPPARWQRPRRTREAAWRRSRCAAAGWSACRGPDAGRGRARGHRPGTRPGRPARDVPRGVGRVAARRRGPVPPAAHAPPLPAGGRPGAARADRAARRRRVRPGRPPRVAAAVDREPRAPAGRRPLPFRHRAASGHRGGRGGGRGGAPAALGPPRGAGRRARTRPLGAAGIPHVAGVRTGTGEESPPTWSSTRRDAGRRARTGWPSWMPAPPVRRARPAASSATPAASPAPSSRGGSVRSWRPWAASR